VTSIQRRASRGAVLGPVCASPEEEGVDGGSQATSLAGAAVQHGHVRGPRWAWQRRYGRCPGPQAHKVGQDFREPLYKPLVRANSQSATRNSQLAARNSATPSS